MATKAPPRMKLHTMRSYQFGGDAEVGLDPNDPRNQAFGTQPFTPNPTPPATTTAPQYNIIPPNPYAYAGDPTQNQWNAQNNVYQSRQGEIGAQQGVIGAQTGVLDAQGRTIPLQQGVIDASRGVLDAQGNVIPYSQAVINAQRGTIGPQQNYIGAQGNVIGAQEQVTGAERGYIGQQQQANAADLSEEQQRQAAHANLADQTAVGQAQTVQNTMDYQYGLADVAKPTDVIDDNGQPLPPGVRPLLRTQEEIVTEKTKQAANLRNIKLQGAKLAVDLLGTNVDAAREAAARVGLTVDQAKLLVQQAGIEENQAQLGVTQANLARGYASNALDQGQLGVTQAQLAKGYASNALDQSQLGTAQSQLDLSRSGQPPAPGLVQYTNPTTGESQWVTPAQRAQLETTVGPSASGATTQGQSSNPTVSSLKKLTINEIAELWRDGQVDKSVAIQALIDKGYPNATAAESRLMQELAAAQKRGYVQDINPANKPGATSGVSSSGIDVSGLTPR